MSDIFDEISGLDDLVEDSQTQTTSKDTPVISHSKAEELAFRSRTARMEKLKRRRDAARAYKELENKQKENDGKPKITQDDNHSEDQDDFSVDAGPRARQRRLAAEFKRICGKKHPSGQQSSSSMTGNTSHSSSGLRRLSTRSDSTASLGYGDVIPEGDEGDMDEIRSIHSTEKSLFSEENKSNQPTIYHALSTDTQHSAIQSLLEQRVDMLEWDRQEREQELDLMQEMIKYSQQVKEETKKVVRKAAKETAKNTAMNVSYSSIHIQLNRIPVITFWMEYLPRKLWVLIRVS